MKRYMRYKDSGVNWIGEIPEYWGCVQLRRVSKAILTGGTPKQVSEEHFAENGLCWFTPSDFGEEYYLSDSEKHLSYKGETQVKVFPPNCILMICIGGTMGKVALATIECSSNQQINAIITNDFINERYLLFYLKSLRHDIFKTTKYTTLPILNQLGTKEIPTILPPLPEQRHIVTYLDAKVTLIDRYISKREEEIARLKEWKQALISKAVTKGLDPNAKMKDSGIAWIGEVPEKWGITTMRAITHIVSDKNHPQEQLLSVVREEGVIIRNVESKEENHNYIPDDLSGYKLVKEGQFVINKMKAWQGSYAVSSYQGIVSPAYYIFNLRVDDKEFFNYAIRSRSYIPFFTQYSKGIRVGQWDLSIESFKNIPFFLPPLPEQHTIVRYIEEKTTKADKLISKLSLQVDYLKEYKQRLISDVVTGKINVQPE